MTDLSNDNELPLRGVIGFNSVPQGLALHPDDEHLIYPLGASIVVKNLLDDSQIFLRGHTSPVSCVAISASGRFLASGQQSHMGFPAPVIVWDLETCEPVHTLDMHKGKVQAVAFSGEESFLATLGNEDDGNRLVVWEVANGQRVCSARASNRSVSAVTFANTDEHVVITGGQESLRVWKFDTDLRKMSHADCKMGNLKRYITCVTVDAQDKFMYCGTTTGDVFKVSLQHRVYRALGPRKGLSNGVRSILQVAGGQLVVGCGDGTVGVLQADKLKLVRRAKVDGFIESLCLNAAGDHFFIGTRQSNVFLMHLESLDYELRATCHNSRINDVAFPANYSELFATCSAESIRVWNARTLNELLRIQVPNLTCLCVAFSRDGKSILSGWDDGKVRAFFPESGRLMYKITDAHAGGVTAICGTSDSGRVITGGADGGVRVWKVGPRSQSLVTSLKEHKQRINSIQMSADEETCITAAADGSCIVWDLERKARTAALFASTQFRAALFHPDQSQILTTGTDRKITYWDAVDAEPIRVMEGSHVGDINTLDITADGERFVSGGAGRVVRVWSYDEGYTMLEGRGHSGAIARAVVSPDQTFIVSIGEEGGIFLWELPEYVPPEHSDDEADFREHEDGTAADALE